MNNTSPEMYQRILEVAEGDLEFEKKLIGAVYSGLVELRTVYVQGYEERNEVKIQQIRHKIKPTITMFDFRHLALALQSGKEILESEGFRASFDLHLQVFLLLIDQALEEVSTLKN